MSVKIKQEQSSRRAFMKTSLKASTASVTASALGLGFVAASEPVMAQAIKTDFAGIKAGEQDITVGSFNMPAYISRPEKASGPLPVVIVVSEIFGVHEYIADTTRRFAKLGYLAIAPEFFTRAGDPNSFGTVAHVFSTYETRETKKGPITNKGINSIQLFFDQNRYYIVNVFWCAESMGFTLPSANLK